MNVLKLHRFFTFCSSKPKFFQIMKHLHKIFFLSLVLISFSCEKEMVETKNITSEYNIQLGLLTKALDKAQISPAQKASIQTLDHSFADVKELVKRL